MDTFSFQSAEALQGMLGEQMQRLRVAKNLDQRTTAEKAGVSLRALRNLETGRGSSVATLVRVLKALDALDGLQTLVPQPTVSPMALLRHGVKPRRRVRRSAKEARPQ